MKKSKEELDIALEKNLVSRPIAIPNVIIPSREQVVADAEEDIKFARKELKELLNTSKDALQSLINVANESEHPRAFEVLANMVKTNVEVIDQITELSKKRKKIIEKTPEELLDTHGGEIKPNGNVAVFIGTTSELQKKLRDEKDVEVIEVK